MDLGCLVKLLLEKEYIFEHSGRRIDGNLVVMWYDFEYDEIYDKIKDSEYDKDNIFIFKSRFRHSGNRFCILNATLLEKGLIFEGREREEFGFRADRRNLGGIPPHELRKIIETKTRFNVTRMNTDDQVYFDLCDSYINEQRLQKEAERKEEILDFLDKLP